MNNSQELQTELTLGDLKIIANLIDVAAQKGMFRAPDLPVIASVYSKISAVLGVVKNEN